MMRYILLVIACIIEQNIFATVQTPKDSLLLQLKTINSPVKRIQVYQNLADIYNEQPEEIIYLKEICKIAQKNNLKEELIETLGLLSHSYLRQENVDSAYYCIQQLLPYDSNELARGWIAYLSMRFFNYFTFQEDDGFNVNEKLKDIDNHYKKKGNDIYLQIKNSFVLGLGLHTQKKHAEAIPYLKTSLDLAKELPLKVGFKYQVFITRYLCKSYALNNQNKITIELIEQLLDTESKYFKKYTENRPFFPVNSYYSMEYTVLMINVEFLPLEKQKKYMQQIFSLCKKSNKKADRYNLFLSMNNYYLYKEDDKNAIITLDSLINIAEDIAPYNVAGLCLSSSHFNAKVGQYQEAYNRLKTAYFLQDSINSARSQDEIKKIQVRYGVDMLEFEKTQLESKNRRILIFALSSILLIVVGICLYLYRNLKKEKAMKLRMKTLKVKAEESEKMKTAFINSVCHEIRTPLNSIVGFTDIILDESIDTEMRQTFPKEIQRNTAILTSLINSMLEISNLDVSDEHLHCEPTDITHLLSVEMDRLFMQKKENIQYNIDVPNNPIIVSTNERYLGLVIENLLENANKFTNEGIITLHFHIDNADNKLIISVSDTGCGIPLDKQSEVFQRFTKLDVYKQGNGLGLYLCKIIVKRLSGSIFINPEYTQGTEIIISLPIKVIN